MPNRPYFTYGVDRLETLFDEANNDSELLNKLLYELEHRRTQRARHLRAKVQNALAQQASSASSPRPVPTAPINKRALESSEVIAPQVPSSPIQVPSFTYTAALETSFEPGEDAVLAAWLTQEVLTPQALPKKQELATLRQTLVRLDEEPEPWTNSSYKKRGREKAVYWMLYLGELDLQEATNSLLSMFPEKDVDERNFTKGHTALAVVVLDAKGKPVEDKLFLSSFAWGYGKVRAGQLKDLASFIEAEAKLIEQLKNLTVNQNSAGDLLALDVETITKTTVWLAETLNVPKAELVSPGIAVRIPHFGHFPEAPEPELLNSFFLQDLNRIRAEARAGNSGPALQAYVAEEPNGDRIDVVQSPSILQEVLAPQQFPLARWPNPGRFPLTLMQQAAVNHALEDLNQAGLVAVNGPPGTGKTTLLRDIVAKVVLDRAMAMARFDNPGDAFSHVGRMKTGPAFTHLYKLHDSLLGHELVVASSNNKAVENISREIPAMQAMANDVEPPLRYFQSVSDAVIAGKGVIEQGATWGLAAAVLGNSANRSAFVNTFWWHKKRGFQYYLKAILGDNVFEENPDGEDDISEDSLDDVVSLEQPPKSELEAQQRWKQCRTEFLAKLTKAQDLQNKTQTVYEAVQRRDALNRELSEAEQAWEAVKTRQLEAITVEDQANQALTGTQFEERRALEDREIALNLRPGFFAWLFQTKRHKRWRNRVAAANAKVERVRGRLVQAERFLSSSQNQLRQAELDEAAAQKHYEAAKQVYSSNEAIISEGRRWLGRHLADDAFWNQAEDELQLSSPWVSKEFQEARDDLFAAAFRLHRAFIDASAKPLRHNLNAAMAQLQGRVLSATQEPARQSLWASLFMVVPLVSTTFASMSRLFKSLHREEIGWLLIDEAGQALPQAAVGAIWRAKRALVIGDPLQIEPVVTTPLELNSKLLSEYDLEADEWSAPQVSCQSLADRNSWFGTELSGQDGDIWVGSPLRVHRRCEEPMFSISNYIAYNDLMVYGTAAANSAIDDVLGKSVWIDVQSEGTGKWSDREGQAAISLLNKLLKAGQLDPDIFFITPFRVVSFNLRNKMRTESFLAKHPTENPWTWTQNRIGTIHTFQGREAEAVVLVLGAPLKESFGARNWAGQSPNLLNVAITRAKRRLYVIGNRELWLNAGSFSQLAQNLPTKRFDFD